MRARTFAMLICGFPGMNTAQPGGDTLAEFLATERIELSAGRLDIFDARPLLHTFEFDAWDGH
jgi:hypothetical protein